MPPNHFNQRGTRLRFVESLTAIKLTRKPTDPKIPDHESVPGASHLRAWDIGTDQSAK